MAPDQISSAEAPSSRARIPDARHLRALLAATGAPSYAPDIVTSLGLLAGCFSLISAINGHFERAAAMIGVCILFDIADGLVARASRTSSRFGLEYDSLSDVITFGVAPAILAGSWALKPLGARHVVGLPVPGAAAAIAGAAFGYSYFKLDAPQALCVFMSFLMPVLAALMVSRVPYPAYKGADPGTLLSLPVIGLTAAIAILFVAVPRLTAFVAGAGYLLSGPVMRLTASRSKGIDDTRKREEPGCG